MTASPLDAIILAGGRARRLDGASKPELELGGTTLLDLARRAAREAGAARVVVVGPPSIEARDGEVVVREDPPFGGPLAGLAAGLRAVRDEARLVLVLACDGAHPEAAVRALAEAAPSAFDGRVLDPHDDGAHGAAAVDHDAFDRRHGAGSGPVDGIHLVDERGRAQWLTAIYVRNALDAAIARLDAVDAVHDGPVRRIAEHLRLEAVPAPAAATLDIDTWDDLERARAELERARAELGG